MLLKVEGEKGDNKSSLFGFLHWTTANLNKLETFLQVYAFDSIINDLIEVFDLSIGVNWALILDLIAIFIMNVVQNHVVPVGEMKYSHQVINEELLNKNQISHGEVMALVNSIFLDG